MISQTGQYQTRYFAAKKQEISLIDKKLQLARSTSPNQRLLIEFFGVPGLGKSWLLRHLAETYTTDSTPPTISLLIDFAQFHRAEEWSQVIQRMSEQIKQQIKENVVWEQNLPEHLVRLVGSLAQSYVFLFLFDTSEQSSELIELLEDQLVYPLLRTGRVVFVFAGRRWLRWKRFEVRRRVETIELGPFDKEHDTPEQLGKLGMPGSLSEELYEYTFGHPLGTRAIIDTFRDHGLDIDRDSLAEHQNVIQQAVRQIVEKRFFPELGSRHKELQCLLELACIPRRFDVTPLKALSGRFYPGEGYENREGGYYLDAIRDMQDSTLVQWNSDWGGYILLPVVRWIMAQNLRMRHPQQFKQWHEAAAEQYLCWIKGYPRNAVGFLLEWIFHRAWILRVDEKTNQQIAEQILPEIEKKWADIAQDPQTQWDLPEMTKMFKDKINQGSEIPQFFPSLYVQIKAWVATLP